MGRRRGVEYTGIPEIVSPGMSIPKTQPKGLAAGGTGSATGTAPEDTLQSIMQQRAFSQREPVMPLEFADAQAILAHRIFGG